MPRSCLLLLLAACDDEIAVGVPWLELPDPIVVTGELGVLTTIEIDVHNTGTGRALVSAAIDPPFHVPATQVDVAPGAVGTLLLSFDPDSVAPADGVLVVRSGLDRFTAPVHGVVDTDADDDGHDSLAAGGDDCDDHDRDRSPSAIEVCNTVDDDCDGAADNVTSPTTWYRDADHDTFGDPDQTRLADCEAPPNHVADATDCDDGDADVFPGADDPWYDGVDGDCDGADDWDADGDGARDPSGGGADCDDTDPTVLPGATEVWYDGRDQDCDGNDDDQDEDGDPVAVDCDDTAPTVGPSQPELDDGLDQDCDSWIDEGLFAAGTLLFTELLENPRQVADGAGRWLELVNPTDGDVDLSEVALVVGSRRVVLDPLRLSPGEVAVLCVDPDPSTNGGVAGCAGTIQWTGTASRVALEVDATGFSIDEVPLGGFQVPNGASRELRATRFDAALNDLNASWCTATAAFGDGDLGTPGLAVPSCL